MKLIRKSPSNLIFSLLAKTPTANKSIWELTQFLMENLHQLFIPRFGSYFNTNDEEDKYRSMYEDDPILKHFNHIEHRKSIMSLVDTVESESDFEIRGGMLSRRNSFAISRRNSGIPQPLNVSSIHTTDVDTLDQVVNVAAHHDTLYSYHYIDETDKTVSETHIHREGDKGG